MAAVAGFWNCCSAADAGPSFLVLKLFVGAALSPLSAFCCRLADSCACSCSSDGVP